MKQERTLSSIWAPSVSEELRQRIWETIEIVAERFCHPEKVSASIMTLSPLTSPSLGNGYSGVALVLYYLGQFQPERQWQTFVHSYLRLAAQATQERALLHPGIFSGNSGLALILSLIADHEPHYQKASQTIQLAIARAIVEKPWPRRVSGVAEHEYDAIGGIAGITGYLLSLREKDALTQDAIHISLQYLVWLAGENREQNRKNWFVAPELVYAQHRDKYPYGYFNLGLSHGVAGPLAALSLAWSAGYRLPGMQEAIETMAAWIVEQRVYDEWGINWPSVVFPDGQPSEPEGTFAGWCYGAPGIARALWLAGTVLADASLCRLAIESIETVLKRPVAVRKVCSPTICHGLSGLLLICMHFANESGGTLIYQHIPLLVQQILEKFDTDFSFGFRDEMWSGTYVDDPGIITGAMGVILTLLAATTSTAPFWDRAFLIA